MSSNSNLALIERLIGRDNFASWRFAVKTYLQHEELWDCVEGKSDSVDTKRDTKARSKIILLVDPVNYIHVQEATTAKEVWQNLCKAFDDSGLTRRVGLLKDLITTTLDTCQNVEEYVNKIISTAHKLRNIGFKVDEEWLGTLLLAGLPDQYKPMIMALESSGVAITADLIKTKLLQEIKNPETSVFYVNKSKFKRNTNKKFSGKGPRCFSCNKYGHLGKDCRNTKKQNDSSYVAVFSASFNNDSSWYIDSGASMHMTMNKDWIYDEKMPPIDNIKVANNKVLKVASCGKVNLNIIQPKGITSTIQVNDVLYIPELSTNLLSVSQMIKNQCKVEFDNKGCNIYNKNSEKVATAKLINNMYRLNLCTGQAYISEHKNSDFYLWHQRMGHLNFSDLKKLESHVQGVKISLCNNDMICVSCLEGKQTRQPFNNEGSRAHSLLETIHSDLCGPMETKSLGGARYFLTFIDDYSRKVFVYILNSKSECLNKFKEFKSLVENQLNCKIKTLRTDNGTEYTNKNFKDFLKLSGIKHQTSTPYTPQQNGLAERMNRTLVEKAMCMLINANLQKNMWAEATMTAAYITNRTPTRALDYATPEEKWSGKKPDISHMRVFGSEVMMHIPKEKLRKWDSKSRKMIFLGYCENTKGYRLFDPISKFITKSRDVVFLESSVKKNIVPMSLENTENYNNISDEDSDDSSVQTIIEQTETTVSDESEYLPEEPIEHSQISKMSLRPREKVRKHDVNTFLCNSANDYIYNTPQTYKEAITSLDSDSWIQSINEELQAHEQNGTWELVEKPSDIKVIGCKWVFKIKEEPSGLRYKSRLCAKGFAQRNGIDYTETFSPTVRYDSIRILLSVAAQHNFQMMQFDIKTAFLHGDLQEYIYMTPPEGLEVQQNKNGAALTWSSQRQSTVALSTTEAEFMAACCATKEALWIKQLMTDIGEYQQDYICLNIDNQSTICLIKNSEYHKRCKHIDIKFNFIRENYSLNLIDIQYVNTENQLADIFTKPLIKLKFCNFRTTLGMNVKP
ncbi:hypothetical protein K1T71_015266 [Dendrolimus kikuchii]|nr:hypothetical protein K1T71_015266 [Dendrolimus kikuchii]